MKMILVQILFCSFLFSCGASQQDEGVIAYDLYVINKTNDNNAQAADYLYYHLNKRAEKGVVLKEGLDDIPDNKPNVQFITIEINPKLASDYEILKNDNTLTLKANCKKTLYWLFYQYLQALSENDSKIHGDDLPPAIVNFKDSKKVSFAFKYRDPHLQANLVTDYDVIINTNNVEKDWGIWGHQLFNLVKKNPKNSFYSTVNGKLSKEQLCFSSPELYQFIENYVIENFGEKDKDHTNFVISPADNNLVCTCALCSKAGNISGNSSNSVIALINKLAIRFPNHNFFTLDYLSVKTPPTVKMPENAGIIVSSIDLPRKVNLGQNNKFIKEFESKVSNWHKVCSTVYVWDYISNFDDYLTPFPTLKVSKSYFTFYKKLNITGVFANGAGYDYSTFNSLQTYVLAALMQNPTLEVDDLVKRYCDFYYGKSGKFISDYVLSLEKNIKSKNISLNLYSGVPKITETYLDKTRFFEFYNTIEKLKNEETDEIQLRLNQLYTGLTFTAMQIRLANKLNPTFGFASLNGDQIEVIPEFRKLHQSLSEHFSKNEVYLTREAQGTITKYLNEIKDRILDSTLKANNLNQNSLKVTSNLDEDYKNTYVLTDGIPGLLNDYHNGWLIVSNSDLVVEIENIKLVETLVFKFNFMLNERFKMRAPEKIEFIINDKIAKTIMPKKTISEEADRLTLETTVDINPKETLKIKIYRDPTFKKFACDEIYL
jgi:hypothetical protein